MANNVTVRYGSKGASQVASDADKLKAKLTGLQKVSAKGFVVGLGASAGLAAFNAVGAAVQKVTGYIGDSADAFVEEQLSIQRLTSSLKANVPAWDGNTAAIERVLQARMALGFSDDEQRESLSKLVAATHDVNEALEVQRTAMDLARFKGISLADATDALTKVEAGSFRILKSLGIVLRDGATQTEALAAVQRVASGQAADYAQTIAGKLTVAQVKQNEAQEKFGKSVALLESQLLPALADAVTEVAEAFERSSNITDAYDEAMKRFRADGIEPTKTELDALARQFFVTDMSGYKMTGGFKEQAIASDAAERAARGLGTALGGINAAPVVASLEDLTTAADNAEKAVGDLSDTLIDELYGDAIAAGREQELKDQIHGLRKELRGTTDDGDAIILAGQLAEAREALFLLHLEQAAKDGPQAAIDFLKKQIDKAGDATGALKRLIDKYQELAGYQNALIVPHSVADQERRKASGGPVSKGVAYTVGEAGPETFVAPSNGTIIPHSNSAGSGGGAALGGAITVNVTVAGGVLTPGGMQSIVQQLGPGLADYLKRRGFSVA